jgi:hypothetical protein
VNEEALAHWGAVAPITNKQTNKHIDTTALYDRTGYVMMEAAKI